MEKTTWDKTGVFISAICILHCILVPLILLFFPLFGIEFIPSEDKTHAFLLAFILGVAGAAFVSGYRVHGQKRPVIWMAGGVALITYATFFAHDQLGHLWEPVVAIIGSLALIRAHILNHRCKTCEIQHGHVESSLHSHEHEEGHSH